jgi:hypothetical protein
MVHRADILFFNTAFQRDIWQKAYAMPPTRCRILENYFPPVVDTYLPARGPVLVSVARTSAFKNQAMLQRIVNRLADGHPALELDTRILPRDEHLKRLAQAHAVVIPSISEVCANTAIDAVSLGKPFVMTDDTGTKERLAACGLFVDTRSEAALEQAIESILDPIVYERLAGKARAFSFTHSWDDMAQEILHALNV